MLAALAGLQQLTSLRFNWQAGRTLGDARLLSALTHLKELQLWLSGGGRELPPCSSKPLPGMLAAAAQLTGLTRLELLQGLYMSWDLREIRHLSSLRQLQVLGLHDSVLCDDDLALLAPCSSLQHLRRTAASVPDFPPCWQGAHTPHQPAVQHIDVMQSVPEATASASVSEAPSTGTRGLSSILQQASHATHQASHPGQAVHNQANSVKQKVQQKVAQKVQQATHSHSAGAKAGQAVGKILNKVMP
ncbi:hypothetical protein OEZ86_013747 [Tetradesmus obliquus]|nr:hypothetical protein OEZ86_013747 [Tetradesmus obliquus]